MSERMNYCVTYFYLFVFLIEWGFQLCVLGVVTRLAGGGSASGVTSGSADGIGSVAMFYNPLGIALDSLNEVFIGDRGNNLIRKITWAGMCIGGNEPSIYLICQNFICYSIVLQIRVLAIKC